MSMHRGILFSFIIVASVVIGGLLYLFGGAAFHPLNSGSTSSTTKPNTHFTIIAEGTDNIAVQQRVNYRITSQEQLDALWPMIYSPNERPEPNIDFSKSEILAVFDGSHTTTGYRIAVDDVKEVDGKRVITVTHFEPADNCSSVISKNTSPFMVVLVDSSPLPVTHEEDTRTSVCE